MASVKQGNTINQKKKKTTQTTSNQEKAQSSRNHLQKTVVQTQSGTKTQTSVKPSDSVRPSTSPAKTTSADVFRPMIIPASVIQSGTAQKALQGLEAYVQDKHKKQEEEKNKSGIVRWMEGLQYQASADAPAAVHGFQEARRNYAADTSWREIGSQWDTSQKLQFGYLYDDDPQKAYDYAAWVNDGYAASQTAASRQHIRSDASRNAASMALHTAGSIGASSLFSMGEYIDRAAQFSTRGRTSERSYLTPWDYSQEVVGGIRDDLNGVDENGIAHAVLDENIPIIGGMGMGDVYGVLHSAAQSWVSANTVGRIFGADNSIWGKAANNVIDFSNAAASTMDMARRVGANGKQAMSLGLFHGIINAACNHLPMEKLMNITPATTVKGFLSNILKQSAMEGASEMISEGLGSIGDYVIMEDLSVYSQRKNYYIYQGETTHAASRLALKDAFQDIIRTGLAGMAAGAVSAGSQTVMKNITGLQNNADITNDTISQQSQTDPAQIPAEFRRALIQTEDAIESLRHSPNRATPEAQQQLFRLLEDYDALRQEYPHYGSDNPSYHIWEEAMRKDILESPLSGKFNPKLYRMGLEMADVEQRRLPQNRMPFNEPSLSDLYGEQDLLGMYQFAAAGRNKEKFHPATLQDDNSMQELSVENVNKTGYNETHQTEITRNRLRFMSNRDQFYINVERTQPLEGYQDIVCHADAYSFAAQDPITGDELEEISPRELAYRILDSGKYVNGPIRLIACSSGAQEDGAAQQLANYLKVPVLAPTKDVICDRFGDLYLADDDETADALIMGNPGNRNLDGWIEFHPKEE